MPAPQRSKKSKKSVGRKDVKVHTSKRAGSGNSRSQPKNKASKVADASPRKSEEKHRETDKPKDQAASKNRSKSRETKPSKMDAERGYQSSGATTKALHQEKAQQRPASSKSSRPDSKKRNISTKRDQSSGKKAAHDTQENKSKAVSKGMDREKPGTKSNKRSTSRSHKEKKSAHEAAKTSKEGQEGHPRNRSASKEATPGHKAERSQDKTPKSKHSEKRVSDMEEKKSSDRALRKTPKGEGGSHDHHYARRSKSPSRSATREGAHQEKSAQQIQSQPHQLSHQASKKVTQEQVQSKGPASIKREGEMPGSQKVNSMHVHEEHFVIRLDDKVQMQDLVRKMSDIIDEVADAEIDNIRRSYDPSHKKEQEMEAERARSFPQIAFPPQVESQPRNLEVDLPFEERFTRDKLPEHEDSPQIIDVEPPLAVDPRELPDPVFDEKTHSVGDSFLIG